MKKVKKVLSAVLVSALLMQSVAVPVSAAEDPFEAAAPTAGESIRPENAPEGSRIIPRSCMRWKNKERLP